MKTSKLSITTPLDSLAVLLASLTLTLGLVSCEQKSPTEEAIEDTADAVEDAVDDVGDAVDDATE